mgnify:FL=1
MRFAKKLENLMKDLGISQTKLSNLTNIGKSSISQYLSGKNEPTEERKKQIALALGVQEDYFNDFDITATIQENSVVNVPILLIAKLMGKSKEWVAQGLQDGVFPWGYAVKLKQWSYFVSSAKFTEYTGIEIPFNQIGQKEG